MHNIKTGVQIVARKKPGDFFHAFIGPFEFKGEELRIYCVCPVICCKSTLVKTQYF